MQNPGDPARRESPFFHDEPHAASEIVEHLDLASELDAGLERLAVVLQGVKSNYDTDLIRPIIDFTAQVADRHYEPDSHEGFAMRVIADHARATAFAIADGILPGNEGRNYVLRKIMRRAIYQCRHTLGLDLFFHKVTDFVIQQMNEAYPELENQRDFIEKMVRLEEERFSSTLTTGLQKLEELFSQTAEPSFSDLAKLYDTFGTPRDLIRVGIEERGLEISEDQFNAEFDAALKLLQSGGREQAGSHAGANPVYAEALGRSGANLFTGYEGTCCTDSRVLSLINSDGEVDSVNEGDEGEVVLDQTPFYAESGGQVGDTGTLSNENMRALVIDTYSPAQGLIVHKVKVEKGSLKVGDTVSAEVDVEKRDATRRNHTATHLMHAALREVLGTHVKQAGSVVAPNYLRFDFTHYQPLTRNEIDEIERLVNNYILKNEPVQTDEMATEEAMRSGAMALFGEKYGEKVRVLSIKGAEGIFSRELCGGTHVRATGDIGVFKITSDESIASGVRRIRAITGVDAYERFRRDYAPAFLQYLSERGERGRQAAYELGRRAIRELRPSADAVQALLPQFSGMIEQIPPQYSAIKIQGERAYDLARDGEVVELTPRQAWELGAAV